MTKKILNGRRINQLLLIAISSLLLLSLAGASTPEYTVEELFDYDLVNGNNFVGELVFVTAQYSPDVLLVSNYSAFSAQQFDLVTWDGSNTVIFTSPLNVETIVTSGNSYYTNTQGNYFFRSISNSSLSGSISVVAKDPNNISLSPVVTPQGFVLSFSDDSFSLVDEKTVGFNLSVDDDVATGVYDVVFGINNVNYSYEFEVVENSVWELAHDNVSSNYTVTSGENVYAGYFLLENVGNVDVEISTYTDVDDHVLTLPAPQTLYRKSELRVDVTLQVPITEKPGVKNYTVFIVGGNLTVEKNVTVVVKDNIKPVIESINFSSDKAHKSNNVTVFASDNNAVEKVTLFYDNKEFLMVKDNNLFSLEQTFDRLSKYQLVFCATDFDENVFCETVEKTFSETVLIVGNSNSVRLPAKKVGQYSSLLLFNLTEDVEEGVFVSLREFVSVTNTDFNDSYTVRISDGDGSIKSFGKFDNEVVLYKQGEVFLEVRSSEVADYTGILSLETPEFAKDVTDIRFEVSFKDYDIPENFVMPWSHNTNLSCVVKDTGDLESTKYSCEFFAPITIRAEDISVPTTISEREQFEREASDVQSELTSKKRGFALIVTFLVVVLIIGGLVSYYLIVHYPFVRRTRGHKLKYKYNEKGDKEYGKK